jgi:mxaC protein
MPLFDYQLAQPFMLLLLPLLLLPWFTRTQVKTIAYANFISIDPLSKLIGITLKSFASIVIACLIISLAQPYIPEKVIERVGKGAEVLMLVDRSRSMDDPFVSQSTKSEGASTSRSVGKGNSKRRVANQYLQEFVNKRPDDRFGFILFSNKALDILPLSYNRESIHATINASSLGRGLSETNIASALIKAAEMYSAEAYRGARTVLLVSDGGQQFTDDEKQTIATLYQQENISLYWIYMGQVKNIGSTIPVDDDGWTANRPEKKLQVFFSSLKIPYRVFSADSVSSFSATMNTIDKQQHQTLMVEEMMPKQSKTAPFLWTAMLILLLLLMAQFYTAWGVRKAHLTPN